MIRCIAFSAGAAEHGSQAPVEEENVNYEEKAQEIVQTILQEVVSTVAGGEISHSFLFWGHSYLQLFFA